jgi:periplasmic divalent cation tolerance protein
MTDAIVVLTTTETPADAERIARRLVETELAACVQVLPPMISIYRWQGGVERATESLLLVKTRRELYAAVEAEIKANHPYQTPEIIALPVENGSADYLHWLSAATPGRG